MVDRLADDHAHARHLAEGLAPLPGVLLDPATVETNIVIFALAPGAPEPGDFVAALAARGVRLGAIGGRRFRAVTHYGIEAADIDRAIAAAQAVLEG
jgi:threonine aldolase